MLRREWQMEAAAGQTEEHRVQDATTNRTQEHKRKAKGAANQRQGRVKVEEKAKTKTLEKAGEGPKERAMLRREWQMGGRRNEPAVANEQLHRILIMMQAVIRRRNARRKVVAQAATSGALLACAGTIQGQSFSCLATAGASSLPFVRVRVCALCLYRPDLCCIRQVWLV